MRYRKSIIILMIICIPLILFGCNNVDKLKIKVGLKNEEFEYIKEGKISKIAIQSTRDKGFRFIVEDKEAIKELYEILSSGKKADKKSELKPDYIFEMYENDERVHQFNYVVGVDSKDAGNLYDEEKIYIVSKRLDNDIVKNFWNIRKPKNFEQVYYKSIEKILEKYRENIKTHYKIGIDIKNDLEINKFILSSDLEKFKKDLKDKGFNIEINEESEKNSDIVLDITTEGYENELYKGIIKIWDKNSGKQKVYYIWNLYENNRWIFNIFEDKKPKMGGKAF